MPAHANHRRRWVALAAAALFVFQALIASLALTGPGLASGKTGAAVTAIICTASGPRVVTLDIQAPEQSSGQHSGEFPHCCVAGCAMLDGALPPELFLLAWLLPPATRLVAPLPVETHFSSVLLLLQQRSRAPPLAA